ncbi:hypothetical protein CLV92_109177 [Kineococcus xinjiangensis]|uniref:Uncharacterized protein n=1 Tax=Kineococcus xinjiangensis TaxID=512762 RepID=A0A2S6II56_9ACTN|nr:hypothetical protein [Kineococcus xinjiangensis]PPK93899.1 hypothetical protein CLV92_109177 [Kineococcus xinjiangensis]
MGRRWRTREATTPVEEDVLRAFARKTVVHLDEDELAMKVPALRSQALQAVDALVARGVLVREPGRPVLYRRADVTLRSLLLGGAGTFALAVLAAVVVLLLTGRSPSYVASSVVGALLPAGFLLWRTLRRERRYARRPAG